VGNHGFIFNRIGTQRRINICGRWLLFVVHVKPVRTEPRCWTLWLDTVWEICEGGQGGEVVAQHMIACQLERGHAHEHESRTEIADVWWRQ